MLILDYLIFFNLIQQDEIRGTVFDTTILGNKRDGHVEDTSS